MSDLKKLANAGDVAGMEAWIEEQKRAPPVADLLWCALATDSAEVRRVLVERAMRKKITPKKKGWPWNDALAAAIRGDVEDIARADKRGADFEAVSAAGTPLTTAIRLGHLEFVRALLERGVDTGTAVRMARVGGLSMYGNMMMTQSTPLGVALRGGDEEMSGLLLEHVTPQPLHLGDAVHGGNETLVRRLLDALGDDAQLEPSLFWRVREPAILPVLEEHGLDLSELPDDHGSWGGPIWSWWAYYLRGGETRLDCFTALFGTGVRATAAGLGEVLEANVLGIASTEMIDLFAAHGADLTEEVEWEGDDWDDENDCQKIERGSLAERLLLEADLDIVQHVHAAGAEIRPLRPNPDWPDAEEKQAWLESLGLVKALDANAFPWVDSPSDDEVRTHLATEAGIYGLRLGMTRDELPEGFDLDRAEEGDGLFIAFDDDDCLEQVERQYYDLSAEVFVEALTAALGKPKGRGKTLKWKVPGGGVELRENWSDAGLFVNLSMNGFD